MPEHGTEAEQLLKNADLALYKAKSEGRNIFRVFDASLERDVRKVTPRWSGAPQGPKREQQDEWERAFEAYRGEQGDLAAEFERWLDVMVEPAESRGTTPVA
jgi:transketolase